MAETGKLPAVPRLGLVKRVDWTLACSFVVVAAAQLALLMYLRTLEREPAKPAPAAASSWSQLPPFLPSSRVKQNVIVFELGQRTRRSSRSKIFRPNQDLDGGSGRWPREASRKGAGPRAGAGVTGARGRADLLRQVGKMGALRVLKSMRSPDGRIHNLLKPGYTGEDIDRAFSGAVGDTRDRARYASLGLLGSAGSSPSGEAVSIEIPYIGCPGVVRVGGEVDEPGAELGPFPPGGPPGGPPGFPPRPPGEGEPPPGGWGMARGGRSCLRACYRRSTDRTRAAGGKVIVRIEVDRRGRVARTTMKGASVQDPRLVSCFKSCIKRRRFPDRAGTEVYLVFILRPGRVARR